MSHMPILPQNLWVLLNFPGFGFLPNFNKDTMMRMIQINEVVMEKKYENKS